MAKKNVEMKQLKLALSTGAAQNLSQMQAKLLQEFTNSAELLRDDMNRIYTHFIAVAANSYELCHLLKDVAKFYWVPTNEWIELPDFEDFIKMYTVE